MNWLKGNTLHEEIKQSMPRSLDYRPNAVSLMLETELRMSINDSMKWPLYWSLEGSLFSNMDRMVWAILVRGSF